VVPPEGATNGGHDPGPYLCGAPGTHRPQQFAVHFPHGRHNSERFTTWVDGRWKLIYPHACRGWRLIDVAADSGEPRNVVAGHPQQALAVARAMIEHLDAMAARWPLDKESGRPVKPDLSPLEGSQSQTGGF
jgi:hypothetical protein